MNENRISTIAKNLTAESDERSSIGSQSRVKTILPTQMEAEVRQMLREACEEMLKALSKDVDLEHPLQALSRAARTGLKELV